MANGKKIASIDPSIESKNDFDLISINKNSTELSERACVCVCVVPAFGQSHVLVSFYSAR